FSVIAGGDIERARVVESDVPDVFGTRVEVGSSAPGGFRGTLGGLGSFHGIETLRFEVPWFYAIHLAVGSGGRVDDAVLVDHQRLNLQFLRLEDGRGLAVRRDAI